MLSIPPSWFLNENGKNHLKNRSTLLRILACMKVIRMTDTTITQRTLLGTTNILFHIQLYFTSQKVKLN